MVSNFEELTLIDGPSFLLRKLKYQSREITCASTFQILAQLVKQSNRKDILPVIRYKQAENNVFHKSSLNGKNVTFLHVRQNGEDTQIERFKFEGQKLLHINFSVFSVNYSGMTNFLCSFGGLAVFDHAEKIGDICSDIESSKPSRNSYSSHSQLTVHIYSYTHLSSIDITAHLSVTQCTLIKVDPCLLNYYCFYNKSGECSAYLHKLTTNSNIQIKKVNRMLTMTLQPGKCGILQYNVDYTNTSVNDFMDDYYSCCIQLHYEPFAGNVDVVDVEMVGHFAGGYLYDFETTYFSEDRTLCPCKNFFYIRQGVNVGLIDKLDISCVNNTFDPTFLRNLNYDICPIHNTVLNGNALVHITKEFALKFSCASGNDKYVDIILYNSKNIIKPVSLLSGGAFLPLYPPTAHHILILYIENTGSYNFACLSKSFLVTLDLWAKESLDDIVLDDILSTEWNKTVHLSCVEPMYYFYVSQRKTDLRYRVTKHSTTNGNIQMEWIKLVPTLIQNEYTCIHRVYPKRCDPEAVDCQIGIFISTIVNGLYCGSIINFVYKPYAIHDTHTVEFNKMSWNDAAGMCYKHGRELPIFHSKTDLEAFTANLRVLDRFHFIQAIFIGLYAQASNAQVSMSDICSTKMKLYILYFSGTPLLSCPWDLKPGYIP